jgi:hypothetical protein
VNPKRFNTESDVKEDLAHVSIEMLAFLLRYMNAYMTGDRIHLENLIRDELVRRGRLL